MEDMILKFGELGIVGIIALFLLTKGTSALNELSKSNEKLAEAVTKLSDKVNSLDSRVITFEYELRGIGSRLDKIENAIAKLLKE